MVCTSAIRFGFYFHPCIARMHLILFYIIHHARTQHTQYICIYLYIKLHKWLECLRGLSALGLIKVAKDRARYAAARAI